MSSPFIGQIMIFGGNFAPAGWAFCAGQLLPIAEHAQLFKLIGNVYGGDGVTSFALPDLRGRVPLGQGLGPGLSPFQLGASVGGESVMLTTAQMPSPGHVVGAVAGPGTSSVPAGDAVLAGLGGQAASGQFETPAYAPPGSEVALHPATIAASGGGQPHQNMQPYLVFNFCIALSGANP